MNSTLNHTTIWQRIQAAPPMKALVVTIACFVLIGSAAGCAGQRPSLTDRVLFDSADALPPLATPTPTSVVPADTQAASPDATNQSEPALPQTPPQVERLTVEIIESFPHDPEAFTQGLVVEHPGTLLESTGLVGRSDLRRVDLATGEITDIVDAPPELFAEGLASVDDRLIQLTWKSGRALVWDAESFTQIGEFSYPGEGWGICNDGERFVMSDGSASLWFRDTQSFELLGSVPVLMNDVPLARLNELECVDGFVWANVWQTDLIVKIDPATGYVHAAVDGTSLLDPRPSNVDVLNGIAYEESSDTFLVTGKLWPEIYRVRFVPVQS